MSILAPLFLAGIGALSLPLLFHFIRKTPRGQIFFSSVMFLSPSPPRLTRRSRLNNILLLILRCTALILLAAAFTRPFFRESRSLASSALGGRRVSLLVDRSASMSREDLWDQAIRTVEGILENLEEHDRVALYLFDHGVERLLSLDDQVTSSDAKALLMNALRATEPSSGSTNFDSALIRVADDLDSASDASGVDGGMAIHWVGDLQAGARTDALSSYHWPASIALHVHPVVCRAPTNAGLRVIPSIPDQDEKSRLRIRVTNSEDAASEIFEIRWSGTGELPANASRIQVPPGQSRVLRLDTPTDAQGPEPQGPGPLQHLVLRGDDHVFDNTCFIAPRHHERVSVRYIGTDKANDSSGMLFYLQRALESSSRLRVTVSTLETGELLQSLSEISPRMIVLTETATERGDELRRYVDDGGLVLAIVKEGDDARWLAETFSIRGLKAKEADIGDYAMLGEINFTNPLFAAFASARYSDFTKIHYWKHRSLTVDPQKRLSMLARFDSGMPAILEKRSGKGRVLVWASGWHPAESQFALSSKFVPILLQLLEDPRGSVKSSGYSVGDRIPLGRGIERRGIERRGRPETQRSIALPDGSIVPLADDARFFEGTSAPGIYSLNSEHESRIFAVNLAPEESNTTPMDPIELETFGIRLGGAVQDAEAERQLRDIELEGRQKVWRWFIASALLVLILETLIAGRGARPVPPASGSRS